MTHGVFLDPKHPEFGVRFVVYGLDRGTRGGTEASDDDDNKNAVHVFGSDEGYNWWYLSGKIVDETPESKTQATTIPPPSQPSIKMRVDFSPKGGPADLLAEIDQATGDLNFFVEGQVEPASTDEDGDADDHDAPKR